MRGRILYGDSRDVERPGNFQNMSRLDSTDFTPAVAGRLDREIGVPSKADRSFHERGLTPPFEPHPRQNDATTAQRESSLPRHPARLARAWLAFRNTGIHIPAAKLNIAHPH